MRRFDHRYTKPGPLPISSLLPPQPYALHLTSLGRFARYIAQCIRNLPHQSPPPNFFVCDTGLRPGAPAEVLSAKYLRATDILHPPAACLTNPRSARKRADARCIFLFQLHVKGFKVLTAARPDPIAIFITVQRYLPSTKQLQLLIPRLPRRVLLMIAMS